MGNLDIFRPKKRDTSSEREPQDEQNSAYFSSEAPSEVPVRRHKTTYNTTSLAGHTHFLRNKGLVKLASTARVALSAVAVR